jgi:hypothetical protein
VNPLQKARARAARSWWTARDGTVRTAGWVVNGVAGAPRRIAAKVRGAGDDAPAPGAGADPAPAADASPGIWDRSGGRLVRAVRARPRAAAAWAGGAVVVAIWIGWTTYTWIENGADAGIGVLISWPAVFAALALVFSPFVGAGLLVRRHRVATDGPAIAGGAMDEGEPGESDDPEDEPDAPDDEADDAAVDESDDPGDEPRDEPGDGEDPDAS